MEEKKNKSRRNEKKKKGGATDGSHIIYLVCARKRQTRTEKREACCWLREKTEIKETIHVILKQCKCFHLKYRTDT